MKIKRYSKNLFGKKIVCIVFGHQFIETKKVNIHFSEFECSYCKMQATNDKIGKKTALTNELKEINETLSYLNLKKEFVKRFYYSKKD
ncbi:hypothetical protein [Flavobacterium macrobrachii]|uniref:Uncharacterized protein n=1 Tax=Flavobacterium macrobrachii TaxID=591204 RepID=A0ABS2D0W9_9FLAO|nr:hypothetical protein [Flavobacterium macrobrachii]MBM6500489.1 hypothetical protein [Flavobacterium macrobrachii]PZO28655.1 MAG: hypothetical protein DCF13_08440 [Flavobacteriaceae bacterium]